MPSISGKLHLLLTLTLVAATACTSMKSPTRPTTSEDREALQELANPGIFVPRLDRSVGPSVVIPVLFDGTRNDRERIPSNQRRTVIGHIFDALRLTGYDPLYYRGPGTQRNPVVSLLDSMIGFSTVEAAQFACKRVVERVEGARSKAPDVEVRVLVAGFSRGAATARQFMNLVQRRCLPLNSEPWRDAPRHYALLYDTVATGRERVLELSLPETVDVSYHFVSGDERRVFFRPIVDQPGFAPGRINTFFVPGVHSDVGASYQTGLGAEYLLATDRLLTQLGVSQQRTFNLQFDAAAEGKHDSRWSLERVMRISPANYHSDRRRALTIVEPAPLSQAGLGRWKARMASMIDDEEKPFVTYRSGYRYPVFQVTNDAGSFALETLRDEIWITSPKIENRTDGHWLTYHAVGTTAKIRISPALIREMAQKPRSRLEIGMVSREGGADFTWVLDGRVRETIGYLPDRIESSSTKLP